MTELAGTLGLHKSTVFRLLGALERAEFVVHDTERQRYQLGPALFRLATQARPLVPNPITSRAALEHELTKVWRAGHAMGIDALEPGFIAIGAPIHNARGRTMAAIGVSGSRKRLASTRVAAVAVRVRQAADRISQRLGDPAAFESAPPSVLPPPSHPPRRTVCRADPPGVRPGVTQQVHHVLLAGATFRDARSNTRLHRDRARFDTLQEEGS